VAVLMETNVILLPSNSMMTPSSIDDDGAPVFRFHRYRAELARHQQKQPRQDEDGNSIKANADTEHRNIDETGEMALSKSEQAPKLTDSTSTGGSSCIENMSHVTIVIAQDGAVHVEPKKATGVRPTMSTGTPEKCSSQDTATKRPEKVDVETALLIRNLDHCEVTIHAALPTLHILDISYTAIHVLGTVASSVHLTKAFQQSSLCLKHVAQQLRMHQVLQFTVYLALPNTLNTTKTWNKGSIILEDSKQVTFVVPSEDEDPSTTLQDWQQNIVKDFGWLRAGLPSPNFTVLQQQEQTEEGNAIKGSIQKADSADEGNDADDDDDDDEL
jgi:predicted  nucleic acid-binding Zn-ribbon protein